MVEVKDKSRELSLAIDNRRITRKFDTIFHDIWERGPVAYEAPGCKR